MKVASTLPKSRVVGDEGIVIRECLVTGTRGEAVPNII
jgi:hypothetical protein